MCALHTKAKHKSNPPAYLVVFKFKNTVEMNLATKQKHRKQTWLGVRWGEINWEIGVDIYTLYIKWTANKELPPD